MTTWLLVWLLVAIVTTGAVIVCVVALARHVLIVGRSARELAEAVKPLADEVAADGERASRRAGGIQPPGRRSIRRG